MPPSKKRGPYKKYLLFGSNAEVPKRTKNYWKARERSRNSLVSADHPPDDNNVAESTAPDELQAVQDHHEIEMDSLEQSSLSSIINDTVDEGNVSTNCIPENNIDERNEPDYGVSENEGNESDEDYHNYNYYSSSNENSSDDSSGSEDEDNSERLAGDNDAHVYIGSPQHNNSDEQINDQDLNSTINSYKDNSTYTIDVLIRTLLILATKIAKNLDNAIITHIADLIDAMIETPLAFTSIYHFKKIVNEYSIPIEIHHLCPLCGVYVGAENTQSLNENDVEDDQSLYCDECKLEINCSTNKQLGNVFLYLSLKYQLQHFCEHHHEDLSYPIRRQKKCSYALEDILDGYLYKNNYSTEDLQGMISVNFSIDGTPLFKSSMTSITPILCTINEIHPHKRKQRVMLVSVYLGSKKPIMNEYLKPFVRESASLFNEGFEYVYGGSTFHKKCRILMGVCDSVERPELRGSKTFRGIYGCGLCKHEGEEIAKGKGHVRVYPIDDNGNAHGEGLRSHLETLIHADLREKGIKHRSALCDIPSFDIIRCLDVDWMHCVPLGVVRQFLKLWFDNSYAEKDFYLGNNIDVIDKILLTFTPSMDVSRTPLKMSDRVHFKAHELVIWLLFYSLPVLDLFLPKKYVKHWSLLVEAISILLKTSILETEVYYAKRCLFNFVKDTETLYGREHISFNVHLLTHLPQSVLDWGPLWSHSAFCYENFHQFIKQLVKSSNAAGLQIMESFRSTMVLEKLETLLDPELTLRQRKLLVQLKNKKEKPKVSSYVNEIGLIGKSKFMETLPVEIFLALQRINVNIDGKSIIQYCTRILINQEIIHSQNYNKTKKRKNYIVLLKNNEIFEIHSFISVTVSGLKKCFAIGKYLENQRRNFFRGTVLQHLYFVGLNENLAAVDATEIQEKVTILLSPNYGISVACKHPNKFEMLT